MLKPPRLEDLSDPTQLTQLPFPSISDLLPTSQLDIVNGKWDYMGREKFTQVLHKFGKLMTNPNTGFFGSMGLLETENHILRWKVFWAAVKRLKLRYLRTQKLFGPDRTERGRQRMPLLPEVSLRTQPH